ncbi:serine hydrolase [Streptomyces auratus]|uniref:Serine hydrolase n=2 Tax=Streptomyces auratus AGR0001 TaxID=1160718 RepID=A0A8B1N2K0_9ACTN|nr:serine hydrolase [Streptomyces auratus]QTZ90863.1 serine hydrolase [Streptomyces auratus AGR0001]
MKWSSTLTAAALGAGAVAGPVAAASPSVAAPQRAKAATSPVRCTSKDRELATKLASDIAKALESRASMASLSFYDRPTGTRCTADAAKKYDSASVAKTIILGALLYQRGGDLTGEEDTLARKMIVDSDNDAATTLWKQLSDLTDPKKPDPVRIQEFLDKAGMQQTDLDKEGFWGLTQVTAHDQAKLLRLFSGDDDAVLGSKARAYALDLMNHVQSIQRWGATAGAPVDSVIHVKNGWLQRSQNPDVDAFDRGDWKVNSMAVLTEHGYDSGLVVLTENNRVPEGHPTNEGWDYGIDTIETISRAIYRDVYPGAEGYDPSRPTVPAAEPPTAG